MITQTRLLDALMEVSEYKPGPYWWKQASMRKLAEMGLVEAWRPVHKVGMRTLKIPAYRITAAGRAELSKYR